MRKTLSVVAVLVATTMLTYTSCTSGHAGEKADESAVKDEQAMVKRGEYLVNAIVCDDCHSPKRMGPNGPEVIPELRFSGFPSEREIPTVDSNVIKEGWTLFGSDFTSAVGPWGMSFAANLTSDATGIGNWKEENFIRAIREGKYKGLENGRPLLPPMPWFVYRNLNDEDLKSIFAYLKTTRPVVNVVPAPKTPAEIMR